MKVSNKYPVPFDKKWENQYQYCNVTTLIPKYKNLQKDKNDGQFVTTSQI